MSDIYWSSLLQSKRQCRRSSIFRHFAEPFQDCNGNICIYIQTNIRNISLACTAFVKFNVINIVSGMCDNCAFSSEIEEMDVSSMVLSHFFKIFTHFQFSFLSCQRWLLFLIFFLFIRMYVVYYPPINFAILLYDAEHEKLILQFCFIFKYFIVFHIPLKLLVDFGSIRFMTNAPTVESINQVIEQSDHTNLFLFLLTLLLSLVNI